MQGERGSLRDLQRHHHLQQQHNHHNRQLRGEVLAEEDEDGTAGSAAGYVLLY